MLMDSAKNEEKRSDYHKKCQKLAHSFLVKYKHTKCRIPPKMKKKRSEGQKVIKFGQIWPIHFWLNTNIQNAAFCQK